jgi:hypothetical protein
MNEPQQIAKSKKRKFIKLGGAITVNMAAKYEMVINAMIE